MNQLGLLPLSLCKGPSTEENSSFAVLVGPAGARVHAAAAPQEPRGDRSAAGRHGPDGLRHEAREGAAGDLRGRRRPRPADSGDQGTLNTLSQTTDHP